MEIYDLIQEISWYFGNQGFAGECCGDLSLIEFMSLKKVHERINCSIQEIGHSLNISKSGISKIINRLEDKGYVQRVQSSEDGRVCCVEITENGIDTLIKIIEKNTEYVNTMLKELSPNSIVQIRNALGILMVSVQKRGFIKSTKSELEEQYC